MDNWDDLWSEAKHVDMLAVAERLGAKLKRHGPHHVGPCPLGCARHDGFIVTPSKHLFLCRPSEATGDAVDMTEHVLGIARTDALAFVLGRDLPDHPRDETPEQREARLKQNDEPAAAIAARKERQRKEEEAKREHDDEAIDAILKRALDLDDPRAAHGKAYLQARFGGQIPHKRLTKDIKFVPDLDYWGARENGSGKIVRLATLPAIVAIIRDVNGNKIGMSQVWLDLVEPRKWKPEGSPANSPRKIKGLKQGGMIYLGRISERLAIGEGWETCLAWDQLRGMGFFGDMLAGEAIALRAAVDLGNLAGGATGTVPHPTLKGAKIANGVPEPDAPGWVVPEGVTEVFLIADGDSEVFFTAAKMAVAARRVMDKGVKVHVHFPPTPGLDWNDQLLKGDDSAPAEPAPLPANATYHQKVAAFRHPPRMETCEEYLDRVSFLFDPPEPEPPPPPEPPDRGAPPIGDPLGHFDWREPEPLPDGLLPVAPFDMAFLPASIAPWVADTADLMQCPADFVAIPAMVALAAVIGRKIAIRPQRNTDWEEVANLWGMIVGPPGSMKSPALACAMKPLRRLEMEARKNNETAMKAYESAIETHKLRSEAAKKKFKDVLKKDPNAPDPELGQEPVEPKPRRYIVDDATYEALGAILVNNPNGVLAYRDELVSLLRTLDREEYAAARGFFLAAWGGKEDYTFDRIIRGTQHIEAACVSLLGATQPNKIADFVKRSIDGAQGDDGMIQRFGLVVWPDNVTWREVDRYADSAAKHTAFGAFERLGEFDPRAVGAVKGPFDPFPYLKFDRAAQEMFSTWHQHFERFVLRDDDLSPALKGHFSKYRKLVPALALINFLADGGEGAISRDALARAIDFSRYLETHARRLYGAGAQNETTAAKAILTHVKRGDLADGFTARTVQQRDWSNLSDIKQVKAGLNLLVDLGWLADRPLKRPKGGRPTAAYFINPLGQRRGTGF